MATWKKKTRCLIGFDETKLQVIAMKSDLLPFPCPTIFGISIAQSAKQIYTQGSKTLLI